MYHQLPQTACIKPCRRQISQNDIFNMTERSQRVLEYTDQFLIIYFLYVVLTFEVSKTNIIVAPLYPLLSPAIPICYRFSIQKSSPASPRTHNIYPSVSHFTLSSILLFSPLHSSPSPLSPPPSTHSTP